jgi:heme/copper-type cytochrome/quinol oxidase subunit 2
MFRLLDTDNHTTLPINPFVRVIITAADVLHSLVFKSLKSGGRPGALFKF